MYSSGMFFVYLFSSALAFALVNRVLRHRLTWLSALSVLTALGWGYIFQGDYIVPAAVFFSFYVFATLKEKGWLKTWQAVILTLLPLSPRLLEEEALASCGFLVKISMTSYEG